MTDETELEVKKTSKLKRLKDSANEIFGVFAFAVFMAAWLLILNKQNKKR